jgi:2-keto-3-deoxy-L-rhamnonate aldolase RhmA
MKRYVDLGVHFILTGSDHAYILAGANQRSSFLRKVEADHKAS